MIDEHDIAEHRRDLGLDEEFCPNCRAPLEASWVDGVKECPFCIQITDTPELREEARRLERENRPHKSRRRL